MHGLIAVVDHGWYQFLHQQPALDKINSALPEPRRAATRDVPAVGIAQNS